MQKKISENKNVIIYPNSTLKLIYGQIFVTTNNSTYPILVDHQHTSDTNNGSEQHT